jgi:hypothetical protein
MKYEDRNISKYIAASKDIRQKCELSPVIPEHVT